MPQFNEPRSTLRKRRHAAVSVMRATIARGAQNYDRAALSRLIPVDVEAIAPGAAATQAIVDRLARALRGERARAGHWTYDLNRHIGLAQAHTAERARLAEERRAERRRGPKK